MKALGLLLPALLARPAGAFHRQTPPVVALTTSGDNFLPRLPAQGSRIVAAIAGNGRQIFRFEREHDALVPLTSQGENDDPTVSLGGNTVAWDAQCNVGCGDGGRQIFLRIGTVTIQATTDSTGTSVNPTLSGTGSRLAFESMGGLAGGALGVRQIYLRADGGTITQVSRGAGTSRNPALSGNGRMLAFDSTSDPTSGADTGVAQIWVARDGRAAARLTRGGASSQRPAISTDGELIAFESRADLAHGGGDAGHTQIFAYLVTTATFYQITSDPRGCSGASVDGAPHGDWRIGYVCGGQGYLHQLRANQRYRLPIDGGDTAQAVAEMGFHFVVVSTTANLLGSGTTSGHQLYLVNLFKRPAVPVASDAFSF